MKLLIVDDEKVIREGVKRTVRGAFPDAEVHLAATPEEAVETLGSCGIDVVLTDILMPGMTGLELMRLTRRRHPQVKWVVISAHSEFAYAQEAVRLGARDYLLKPIGKERLIELIHTLREELRQEHAVSAESRLLKQNLKYLREAVFQRWAAGLDIGRFDMSALERSYPEFHLVLVALGSPGKAHLEHFIVDNVLSELIEMRGDGFAASLDSHHLLGLVMLRADTSAEAFREELHAHLKRYVKVPFQIVHSGLVTDIQSVPEQVRQLRSRTAAPEAAAEREPCGDSPVEVALQYIRMHFHSDLSLEKVASVVYLNPVYFSQLFKQKTGQGYKEYVIHLRMERAKELLQDPQLRLADVAERIGYQDMRHFTQVFRKKFMQTPTEFRQRLSAGEGRG